MNLSVIPQIFYDIIARAIPGGLILFFGYIAYQGPINAKHSFLEINTPYLFSFHSIVMYALVSYFIGFTMSAIWSISLGKVLRTKISKIEKNCIGECITNFNTLKVIKGEPAISITTNDFPPVFVLHDNIRLKSETEACRLLKIQGERRACEVLALSFILISTINIYYLVIYFSDNQVDRIFLQLFLFVSIFVLLQRSLIYLKFYVTGLCNMWLFYNF